MIRKLVLVYLIVVLSFAWGYAAIQYQLFPAKILLSAENFARSILFESPDPVSPNSNESGTPDNLELQLTKYRSRDGRGYQDIDIPGLKNRVRGPQLYSGSSSGGGYRFFYGTFDFDRALHGAILINDRNQVIHQWALSESSLEQLSGNNQVRESGPDTPGRPESRWPQGIAVFSDGSIIVTDDNRGQGIFRLNLCSELEWVTPGRFNDVIESYSDSGIWTIKDESIIELDPENGEVTREISLNDIHLSNPDIAVFTPKRSLRTSKWYHDPVHLNDVEPLTVELSSSFPMFEPGDLLVSYRSLNLVAVLDAKTLAIKWWRTGVSQRQSDVDWEPDGTISVYDNNQRDNPNGKGNRLPESGIRYSRILKINPGSMAVQIIYPGDDENFYNPKFGKHQILPDGSILISSPEQGRYFEVSRAGETVFEFVNRFDANRVLKVSEAKWLPQDFFTVDFNSDLGCG
jgi:DNA-binding beta-propeller fold protein YncE